jgi:hypothetical protein
MSTAALGETDVQGDTFVDIPEAGGAQATEVEADRGPGTANRVSGRVKSRPRWLEDYETDFAM